MRSLLSLLLPVLGLASLGRADLDYPDFSDTTGLVFVGAAGAPLDRLRVCPSVPDTAGGVWHTDRQDVVSPWTSEFVLEMTGGGDGLAFVIQRDGPASLGAAGGGLGYEGLPNSLVLELDVVHDLGLGDPSGNHIAVHSAGAGANSPGLAARLGASSVVPLLADGQSHTIRLTYVPGCLRVFVDDLAYPALQVAVELDALLDLDDGTAWVGFTAACGALWQNHYVDSWSFDEQATAGSGNRPPAAPVIQEPHEDGEIVNPYDVHMETSRLVDPDGDGHASSDFQIYLMTPSERVWEGNGLTGLESLHAHLADGTFVGSYAGALGLKEQEAYVLRVRHRDDSGDAWSDAGPWAERLFQTGASGDYYPLVVDDLRVPPEPLWLEAVGGAEVILPGGGAPPTLALEGAGGEALLTIEGEDGLHNHVTDWPGLAEHVPLRLRAFGGGSGLSLPESDLTVVDHECQAHTLLLPELSLGAAQEAYLWVTADGSTWWGSAGQTEPDFSLLARGSSLPWVVSRPDLEVEVVAEGLTLPVNVAFVPAPLGGPDDPLLYISELYGTIKVMTTSGVLHDYATGLLNYDPTGSFPGSGEQGLTGLAVDPQTGDVLASMLYDAGGPHYPKVVRFGSTDGGLSAASQTTLLDMAGEVQGQSHQVSHLEAHPDGHVFVHMGDGFSAPTAQDLNSFRGKVLRMNLDGTPVLSNPYYDPSDGIGAADYVFASGFRNPFGGGYRELDGVHYQVENGPNIDRLTQVLAGQDYGWNGGSNDMLVEALYNWVPAHAPVNLAFVQPGTFGGSGFPEVYMDRLYVTESGPTYAPGPQVRGKRILELVLDPTGQLVGDPVPVVEYVGPGRATAVGLAAGPDGLYFTELYRDGGSDPTATGARLLRLGYRASGDCDGLGTSYCLPAQPNSTGEAAELHAHGSAHVADNDLDLEAHHLPPNQFGYFLASQTQGFLAGPGGSDGNLCLAGKIGRFASQVQSSGPGGEFSIPVDLSDLPPPLSVVLPGETWNFQAWYRDANPGPTSNFTQGLAVGFH